MAKYRKVDPRIWNDAKFRGLSDDGKLVFFFLLTHPNMTAIGAMRHTLPGMAAELGWCLDRFKKGFGEPFQKGLVKHDDVASFVWLPNFIKYNPPENPNVVKAWDASIDYLPECVMLCELLQHVKGFLEGFPEGFAKPFRKSMPNQEQEQEQEQYTSTPAIARSASDPFPMFQDWKPSEYFQTLAHTSGVVPPEGEHLQLALQEFVPFWLTQNRKRTAHEWDLAFIKAIKAGFSTPKKSRRGDGQRLSPRQKYMEDVGNLLENIDGATNNGCPTRLGQAAQPLPGVRPQRDFNLKIGV